MTPLRPTARGTGLAIGGVALAAIGVAIGSADLTRLGLLGPLVVVVGGLWLLGVQAAPRRHPLTVRRTVHPNPVSVLGQATAHVEVRASDASGRARMAELHLGEQAATALCGGLTLRAQVVRRPDQITLVYPLSPIRRGRWPIGPLVVHRNDPFGVATTHATLGEPAEVAVWPRVVELPTLTGALMGEPDRVALGARSPSPDDAALRDYRIGDDLRRVHWASTARRGELQVRSDERAGMRPASVLVDLPADPAALEWTVSLAASMAIALLEAGHPVRLLGGRVPPDADVNGRGARRHLRAGSGPTARAALLDLTVDLEPAPTPLAAAEDLLTAARELAGPGSDALVLAVVGALEPAALDAFAVVGDRCDALAVVRATGPGRPAHDTLAALRHAGWRACAAAPGDDLAATWHRLLGTPR